MFHEIIALEYSTKVKQNLLYASNGCCHLLFNISNRHWLKQMVLAKLGTHFSAEFTLQNFWLL
jgi:hypothetical protein